MAFASLSEAYGADFATRVNSVDTQAENFENPMNPVRNKQHSTGSVAVGEKQLRKQQQRSQSQARLDRQNHSESFADVSYSEPSSRRESSRIPQWGDVGDLDESDSDTPDEYLRRSLAGGQPRSRTGFPPGSVGEARSSRAAQRRLMVPGTPTDTVMFEPSREKVYAPMNSAGMTMNGRELSAGGFAGTALTYSGTGADGLPLAEPCQNYFFHLDTCVRCQQKLKKRVARYVHALRDRTDPKAQILPGAMGLGMASAERELFTDHDDETYRLRPRIQDRVQQEGYARPEQKQPPTTMERNEVKEDFVGSTLPSSFLVLAFGLMVIWAMDGSKKGIASAMSNLANIKIIN